MTFQSKTGLDHTDWHILRELQADARLSFNELGRRVGLSAPAVAERVRKMEDRGVITGYSVQVGLEQVGLPLMAFIQLRCAPEKCLLKTAASGDFPEILELHKISGSHCSLLKVVVASMQHLEALNERLGRHGPLICNIVTSTAFDRRTIDWEAPDINTVPPDDLGWKS